METYSVQILNPKAIRLLQDLADLELITIRQEVNATSATDRLGAIDDEKAKARERIMRGGSQTLDVEEMVAYVKETHDRKRKNGECYANAH